MKDERIKLLTRRKSNEKVLEEKEKSVSLEISKNPTFYQPADLYKGYLDHHEDRQKFRKDKENLLRRQIKDKHNYLNRMVKEIEELKRMLEITIRERDESSDEEANLGGCFGPPDFICSLSTHLRSPHNLGLLKLTKNCLRLQFINI